MVTKKKKTGVLSREKKGLCVFSSVCLKEGKKKSMERRVAANLEGFLI